MASGDPSLDSEESAIVPVQEPVERSLAARVIERYGWTGVRRAVFVLYGAALVALVVTLGVPTSLSAIAPLVVGGMAIASIGSGWRRLRQMVLDWVPFVLVLVAYGKSRGVADAVGMPLHESDVVHWEKWLCFGTVPTVWMQQHLYDPHHVFWYDAVFTLIYTSHFLATPVLAAVLWVRDRTAWLGFISRVVVLSVAGVVTYILFPEAPPWLASRDGVISVPIDRLSARGWIWLHAGNLQATLANAQKDGANPVAAMPSLHVAFACLVALFIASRLHTRWRYLLALYPVAMGTTLVYTGEHYVVDLVAGVAYATATHLGVLRFERWRAARATTNIPDDLTAGTDDGARLSSAAS